MNQLIAEWREHTMAKIRPKLVIPDFTNRGETGIAVEHAHYLAVCFGEEGFVPRRGNEGYTVDVGHESSWKIDVKRGFFSKQ